MKRAIFCIAVFLLTLVLSYPALAEDPRYSTEPIHSSRKSSKWRIGYLQGGDYVDYKQTLLATIEGLMNLGWISPFDIQTLSELNAEKIWQWLATELESDYLSFVGDAYYSAKWESRLREKRVEEIRQRIQQKNDIDLMIAMGTWAGQDLSNRSLDTNVLVFSASDAVASGIIKSPHDSGSDNLHAQVDPTIYERQLRFFHNIIGFKKLGIIFEDSKAGRSYAGVSQAERLSKELGFKIVPCFAVSDIADTKRREQAYLSCLDQISAEIDALYVTVHGGVTDRSIPMIAQRAEQRRIPTFSQAGAHEVENGLLMSLSRINFNKLGLFQAAIIAKVFNGAKPGHLMQVFEEPLSISLNLGAARNLAYIPPADFIAATDILYK